MSVEAIWTGIARQAAAVTGIKAAYGHEASGVVKAYPEDIFDGPVAVVDYDGSEIAHGSFETLTHEFSIVLWMPRGNGTRSAAVKVLAPMFERFHLAFDQNVGLYGTLAGQGEAKLMASGGFDDDDIEGKPFIVQVLTVRAWESVSLTHSIGPSS